MYILVLEYNLSYSGLFIYYIYIYVHVYSGGRASHSERWQLFEEFCQCKEDWSQSELLASLRAEREHQRKGEYCLMSKEVPWLQISINIINMKCLRCLHPSDNFNMIIFIMDHTINLIIYYIDNMFFFKIMDELLILIYVNLVFCQDLLVKYHHDDDLVSGLVQTKVGTNWLTWAIL